MTTATLVEIADAVTADLNQSSVQDTLGLAFEAKRVYFPPDLKNEDARKKLYVIVCPSSLPFGQVSRGGLARMPTVHVGFIQGVATDDALQPLDDLMRCMEEAAVYLNGRSYTMVDGDEVFLQSCEIPVAYDQEYLREQKVFRSVIVLAFRRDY